MTREWKVGERCWFWFVDRVVTGKVEQVDVQWCDMRMRRGAEWVLPVQVTSKDPQEARVYPSHAKAQARLGNSCWGVDIGPKTLASKSGCQDCDEGDSKVGVMS